MAYPNAVPSATSSARVFLPPYVARMINVPGSANPNIR
jgi:hypothetical protein